MYTIIITSIYICELLALLQKILNIMYFLPRSNTNEMKSGINGASSNAYYKKNFFFSQSRVPSSKSTNYVKREEENERNFRRILMGGYFLPSHLRRSNIENLCRRISVAQSRTFQIPYYRERERTCLVQIFSVRCKRSARGNPSGIRSYGNPRRGMGQHTS